MNLRLLSLLMGRIAFLVAATMAFSLPWAGPNWSGTGEWEIRGVVGLTVSIAIALAVGLVLSFLGRGSNGQLYRKEAMAVVGLSWILATILGALPFLFSVTHRSGRLEESTIVDSVPMNVADAIFESASGFSTTGATVITNLESPELVPRCILFWRSTTHLLGGLGIIVLFVAILGQGSAGKALMRAEMPGPNKEGSQTRMQHTAWVFAGIYLVLNAVLAVLLTLAGLSVFDALCHAFGTMATGGFSTYNASVGYFATVPEVNAFFVELSIFVFMILAGTNFSLLYLVCIGKVSGVLRDIEWRTYMAIIVGVMAMVVGFGMWHGDFTKETSQNSEAWLDAVRYGGFQVVSILTTTGYGTHNFDGWNSFGRGVLFLLMFVGGCAGSTGGGLKVIRHILFLKILALEIEHAFHPSVVRPLRLGGEPVDDPELRKNVLVYFGLILVIFVFSWMLLVTIEPDSTWSETQLEHKLIDAASGISATLNNIGPGLGIVGAAENYAKFTVYSKLLFSLLMMIGRLEVFVILVLFWPSFWRSQ